MSRRSKCLDLKAAAELIEDGDHLAVGGIWSQNSPMALVRAIIRRGVGDLTLSAGPAAGFAVELLVASGCVRRTYLPNVTFEELGLAPAYRGSIENGSIEAIECDEAILIAGYRAAAAGLPRQPVTSICGSALAAARSDLGGTEGESTIDVPALCPDVVLLHAQEGDEFGNLRQHGSLLADRLMAKAAGRAVVASVDRLVSNEEIRRHPDATTVPCYLVSGVVELRVGAHPCGSHGMYRMDADHIRSYALAARAREKGDPEHFSRYRDRFVTGPADHDAYLRALGGPDELLARLGEGEVER